MSINSALTLADLRADNGDEDAAKAIRYCARAANTYRRITKDLAWACLEKNARKRANVIHRVLMELDAQGESTAELPMRAYLS